MLTIEHPTLQSHYTALYPATVNIENPTQQKSPMENSTKPQ